MPWCGYVPMIYWDNLNFMTWPWNLIIGSGSTWHWHIKSLNLNRYPGIEENLHLTWIFSSADSTEIKWYWKFYFTWKEYWAGSGSCTAAVNYNKSIFSLGTKPLWPLTRCIWTQHSAHLSMKHFPPGKTASYEISDPDPCWKALIRIRTLTLSSRKVWLHHYSTGTYCWKTREKIIYYKNFVYRYRCTQK